VLGALQTTNASVIPMMSPTLRMTMSWASFSAAASAAMCAFA